MIYNVFEIEYICFEKNRDGEYFLHKLKLYEYFQLKKLEKVID